MNVRERKRREERTGEKMRRIETFFHFPLTVQDFDKHFPIQIRIVNDEYM